MRGKIVHARIVTRGDDASLRCVVHGVPVRR
jgi:hypothetical protein